MHGHRDITCFPNVEWHSVVLGRDQNGDIDHLMSDERLHRDRLSATGRRHSDLPKGCHGRRRAHIPATLVLSIRAERVLCAGAGRLKALNHSEMTGAPNGIFQHTPLTHRPT